MWVLIGVPISFLFFSRSPTDLEVVLSGTAETKKEPVLDPSVTLNDG